MVELIYIQCYAKQYLAPERECISDLTNLCNSPETRDTYLALAPFDDKYMSSVD